MTLTLELPNSLHQQLATLVTEEDTTINQWVTLAIAEKMSALRTVSYLQDRASRGNRAAFEAVLAKVPDVEPEAYDR